MGHCAAHTADFAGCAAGGPGVVVSGAAQAGGARLDRFRVGSVGEQPEGEVLQTDRRRAETIDGGDRDLETIHRSGTTDSENGLNEKNNRRTSGSLAKFRRASSTARIMKSWASTLSSVVSSDLKTTVPTLPAFSFSRTVSGRPLLRKTRPSSAKPFALEALAAITIVWK